MASLLYRLGRLSARRAWVVIAAWIVVLGLAGGSFALFGGTLTTAVSIPGTKTQEVSDQLADEFPQASGGTGSVVFTTSDDSAFTADQQADIVSLLGGMTDLDDASREVWGELFDRLIATVRTGYAAPVEAATASSSPA